MPQATGMPPMPSAQQPRPMPTGMPGQPPPPADPSDVMPTQPRQLPPSVPPSPAVLQARWVPHLPAPGHPGSQAKKRPFLQPWMVIVAIILAAAVAGVVIAMSGPDVAVQHSK
jgi:hypothetical protein